MVDHDRRIRVAPNEFPSEVDAPPTQKIHRQRMPRRRREGAVRAGIGRIGHPAIGDTHPDADGARRLGPSRDEIVEAGILGIDRRHHPEPVGVFRVNLQRVAGIVEIGGVGRHHHRAIDADAVHGGDHFVPTGRIQPMRGARPRSARIIAFERMHLNVDDRHDFPQYSPPRLHRTTGSFNRLPPNGARV